ncbi:MAG: histidine--tRNA ligase [Candidatus Doudnabacteria bacterium]|nr:histidine--tRNA ligase [Candidatus Doudnabacteria bacterium]
MSEIKNKLSLEPYKGTRDFYPKEQFVQNYIFSVWKKVCESYGYLEYNASILEETELYKSKSGEEIVNEQTYSFTDRGGRNVTIRPEMTPTVARMVAQKRKELTFPLRWFSVPNLFRYERPQRGRLREHWQLNADMFGVDGMEADVEVISLAHSIMKGFGAKDSDFNIRISNRKLTTFLLKEFFRLDEDKTYKVFKLIDKMKKLPESEFKEALEKVVGEIFEELYKTLKSENLESLNQEVLNSEGGKQVKELFEKLNKLGINNLVFDFSIVRGFDYYTGTVFEVYDTSPENNRALFGGGRYDDLVGIFGVEKVPGIGFGMGDVTMRDFLETHALMPEYKPAVKLYICHLEGCLDAASSLGSYLRELGINVSVDLTNRKVSLQVKAADREKIPYVLVVGEEEVKTGKFKVKNLKDSSEIEVEKEKIVELIK